MTIATVLGVSLPLTIAAVAVLVAAFWLYSRSGKHLDD
jgi:hypothetical protein